jgi:hypothetical protein
MKRAYVFLSLILLGIFSTCAFSGDEQSFSISKSIEYSNYPVRLAVNTNTGDVLVVWMNIKAADSKRLYAALCKLSKSGKFRVKKAGMLSGDKAFIGNFDVAYNPLDNSYMVVADAHESSDFNSPTNLYSQKLDGKGKPAAAHVQLTAAGKDYVSPVIVFVPGTLASPTILANGNYLMAYDRPAKTGESEQAGVYTTFLDAGGRMVGISPQLVSPEINWLGYGFVLALRKKNVNGAFSGFLLRLDLFGRAIKQVELGDYVSMQVEFIQLTSKICFLSWDNFGYASPLDDHLEHGYEGECYNQLYRPGLQKVRGPFDPLDDGVAYITELVKLNDDPGGYQLACDGESLLGRYINKKGKLGPQTTMLFDHQGLLYMMDAVCLPGSNRIFVAWVEMQSAVAVDASAPPADVLFEVKGFVFDAR